jgi:predicted transcriptional regulator
MLKNIALSLDKDNERLLEISRALSSPQRLEILALLNASSLSIKELSSMTKSPMSSTLLNVNILAACGLIEISETYTRAGKSKLCSRNCDHLEVAIHHDTSAVGKKLVLAIPIGNYSDYDVARGNGCGIATIKHTIGVDNDPDIFFSEERYQAAYIWFGQGSLTYRISNRSLPRKLSKISLAFEACSEAPFYRNDWKSDITLFFCGKEVGTWTSLGDFGGRRGINNPSWWPDALTQFGVLTTWEIRPDGTYVNNEKISDVTVEDIDIKKDPYISFTIGVKPDAKYVGGLSLFGKGFGDYGQDIIATFNWD